MAMLSKFFRPMVQLPKNVVERRVNVPILLLASRIGGLIPPSQYDTPIPKRLHIMYALRVYWETIPLFITAVVAVGGCVSAIAWACNNKVDVVFSTHSRRNISRTMDLRNPTVHKIVIINQRYEPWPEMQDVLDKMVAAEKRAQVRMQSCSHA